MTTNPTTSEASIAAQALAAAGDVQQAQDVGALDDAANAAAKKLGKSKQGLVERLIYGPQPDASELQSGARGAAVAAEAGRGQSIVDAAVDCIARGEAFAADGKLSASLRKAVADQKAYGFTVPTEFGGRDGTYGELALTEEDLAANGLGALAVEISGELTIGAGSLLAYGTDPQQKTYLPLLAEGHLMGFALTEVRIGVNAKKVRAYVEWDEAGDCWRLHATGDRNKLWITNATHGALLGLVARVGKDGKNVGLFLTQLPEQDVRRGGDADYEFSCEPSRVDAFLPNHNSRLHFDNFPIPKQNQIQADGVEVLFYCLRMGRCMLAAMSAGYQRMFARDASNYAIQRLGVGGPVIKHELPRLALGKMLGGALQCRALSHISLQQDADGVDLAGLRDLTKSAAATTALESLVACERVLGGRSFTKGSRVSDARANMHVFGVVEGEDDLILMGMVKDITARFTDDYMAGMLGVIRSINNDKEGKPLPREERILRIGPGTILEHPGRVVTAAFRLLGTGSFWKLKWWGAKNLVTAAVRLPGRLVPTAWFSRYAALPKPLRRYARFAERKLRGRRWTYLWINMILQLELTRAQIPLQRFGKTVEHLVSMLVLCHHAALQDESQQRVAALQCELLTDKFRGIRILAGLSDIKRLRGQLAGVARDVEKGKSTLLDGVEVEEFSHPWEPD